MSIINAIFCQNLPFIPFSPFFLLAVKTIGVFNPGKNWKVLARRCAFAEAPMESQFQLLIQLFIVFTRADRAPSSVQSITMASSVVMLCLTTLDVYRRTQKTVELGDDVRRTIHVLPFFLTTHVSTTGCMALLATLLRYWVLVPCVLVMAAWTILIVYFRHHPKYRAMLDDETRGRVSIGQIEVNELSSVSHLFLKFQELTCHVLLIGMTIAANLYPSLYLPGLFWEVI